MAVGKRRQGDPTRGEQVNRVDANTKLIPGTL